MSEPIRTIPTQRKQLAAALKRNMARRKGVARELATIPKAQACVAAHAEPQSGWGPRSVGGKEPLTINKGPRS